MPALAPHVISLYFLAIFFTCTRALPLAAQLPQNRQEFFQNDKMYYVKIQNWDQNKLSPDSLKEFNSTYGATLEVFKTDPYSNQHCPDDQLSEEKMLLNSKRFLLKLSGHYTWGTPKSSYKIKLDGSDNRLLGMKILNLKSMWNDPSQMREALAWKLFQKAQVMAPQHTYAKLCINNKYYGLFSIIEEVDKTFLQNRFNENFVGKLYKGYWEESDLGPATLNFRPDEKYFKNSDPDTRTYCPKTFDDKDDPEYLQSYGDLALFIKVLNGLTLPPGVGFNSDQYRDELEKVFDVYGFLKWAAVNILLGSWDNYWLTPANYYLYNRGAHRELSSLMQEPYFSWIPWDYDNSFGISYWSTRWEFASLLDWHKSRRSSNFSRSKEKIPLIVNVLSNDRYKSYYMDFIEAFMKKYYRPTYIKKEMEQLWGHLATAAYLESDFSDCQHVGTPHPCSHTGRQFSNHEVYLSAHEQSFLRKGPQRIDGIIHFVRMRRDSALKQLHLWRLKYPRRFYFDL